MAGVAVVGEDAAVDVDLASHGRFGPDPQAIYGQWAAFRAWAQSLDDDAPWTPFDARLLRSPAPRPRQVFAIGLNYGEHAAEAGFARPDTVPVFTKFPTCITGPYGEIRLPAGSHTDWEVELVVVIGPGGANINAASAWDQVAGLAVGQDLSERILQMASPSPQFSLGKSYPGFGPIGPWLVTVDEFDNPDDVGLGCFVNGEEVQKARTSELLFPVPALLESLSHVTPLLPGDVVFTGTPSGVGMSRTPPRFLAPGDELVSYVEGIGELRHQLTD